MPIDIKPAWAILIMGYTRRVQSDSTSFRQNTLRAAQIALNAQGVPYNQQIVIWIGDASETRRRRSVFAAFLSTGHPIRYAKMPLCKDGRRVEPVSHQRPMERHGHCSVTNAVDGPVNSL